MQTEPILVLAYLGMIILIIVVMAIIFFSTFIRRKNRLVLQRLEAEQKFEQELANSQLEIQEQTFKNIAWELHDNVGQLLSVAHIQLNMLSAAVDKQYIAQLDETKGVVSESLREIRNLSRSLNKEVVLNNGLVASIELEMERFNRMNFLSAILEVQGEERCINGKDQIFIYRILQEFFSNVIKHAKADNLFVNLSFKPQKLVVQAKDDGVGFNKELVHKNAGLFNMNSRAALINAKLDLTTQPGEGVQLTLEYPYKKDDRKEEI